eukprot:1652566-Rhodomonas_salina.2
MTSAEGYLNGQRALGLERLAREALGVLGAGAEVEGGAVSRARAVEGLDALLPLLDVLQLFAQRLHRLERSRPCKRTRLS